MANNKFDKTHCQPNKTKRYPLLRRKWLKHVYCILIVIELFHIAFYHHMRSSFYHKWWYVLKMKPVYVFEVTLLVISVRLSFCTSLNSCGTHLPFLFALPIWAKHRIVAERLTFISNAIPLAVCRTLFSVISFKTLLSMWFFDLPLLSLVSHFFFHVFSKENHHQFWFLWSDYSINNRLFFYW